MVGVCTIVQCTASSRRYQTASSLVDNNANGSEALTTDGLVPAGKVK